MVAKHRIKRVKRVRRTRKQTKQVRRGRKTYTRHNRRTGGASDPILYNPYLDVDDIDTTPPPLKKTLTLAQTQSMLEGAEQQLSGLNRTDDHYEQDFKFWTTQIAELKDEIATLKQKAS
jgi:hypothetical protein